MGKGLDDFNAYRARMNERILDEDHAAIKRFFGVDTLTYQRRRAAVRRPRKCWASCASMVLRCDDCVSYHHTQCRKQGVTRAEFFDIFSVALTVGGSIVIPHLRRAVAFLDELESADRDRMA